MAESQLNILLQLRDNATKPLKKNLGTLDSQAKNTSKTVTSMGTKLRAHWMAATAAIMGFIAATRGIVTAMKAFADFEQGLTNIKILLGENFDPELIRNHVFLCQSEVEGPFQIRIPMILIQLE